MPATRDTGRAASGDIDPDSTGAGRGPSSAPASGTRARANRAADGTLLGTSIPAANFLTWWDGDLLREITDHDWDTTTTTGVPTIAKWSPSAGAATEVYRATGTLSNNSTKGTPALQADLFGDWREEARHRLADSSALRIATTVDVTQHRLRTLQSDGVPARRRLAEHRLQPAAAHVVLPRRGDDGPPAPRLALTGADPGPGERVPGPLTGAPARGALSSGNWDGDGTYTVALNVWWGRTRTR